MILSMMTWTDVEKAFNRALIYSFSWTKALLVFPALVLCGILIVFCRALHFGASEWMGMSLVFLPILLSSAILLSVGVLVIRMYQLELKQVSWSIKKILVGSLDAVLGTSYLSIPPILLYLLLWMVLGIFFLMKEIPGVGHVFNTILLFIPFLLILGSILLCVFSVALLFFVAPAAAKFSAKRIQLAKVVVSLFRRDIFGSLILFFVALFPIGLLSLLLTWAAALTNVNFSYGERSWTLALEWFFMMFPFAAFLTPAVIFFFQFAVEASRLRSSE